MHINYLPDSKAIFVWSIYPPEACNYFPLAASEQQSYSVFFHPHFCSLQGFLGSPMQSGNLAYIPLA